MGAAALSTQTENQRIGWWNIESDSESDDAGDSFDMEGEGQEEEAVIGEETWERLDKGLSFCDNFVMRTLVEFPVLRVAMPSEQPWYEARATPSQKTAAAAAL